MRTVARPGFSLRLFAPVVAVALMLMGGRIGQAAGGKPTVAVLGLEVVDRGAGIDTKASDLARQLTVALRAQPTAGGPYTLASGGERDLFDEKLMRSCEGDTPACIASIGADIGTDQVLYGKVEKRPTGYQVSITLLTVGTKQPLGSTSVVIPFAETTSTDLARWSRQLYGKVVGLEDAATPGTVVVQANVDRGQVFLDGDAKGELTGGALSMSGVAPGKHQLAIEADGHGRYESSVAVEAGSSVLVQAELEINEVTPTPDPEPTIDPDSRPVSCSALCSVGGPAPRPGAVWRGVFWGSAVVAIGGTGLWAFSYIKERNAAADISIKDIDSGDCDGFSGRSGAVGAMDTSALDRACRYRGYTTIAIPVTITAGAVAAVALYMGYLRHPAHASEKMSQAARRRRTKPATVVGLTPVLAPDGAGAVVRIDF